MRLWHVKIANRLYAAKVGDPVIAEIMAATYERALYLAGRGRHVKAMARQGLRWFLEPQPDNARSLEGGKRTTKLRGNKRQVFESLVAQRGSVPGVQGEQRSDADVGGQGGGGMQRPA